MATNQPTLDHSVPLINFVNAVPVPLTTVLVGLAPYISRIRQAAEIISWRSSWADSWFILAAWWALCLLAELGLRYLLPLAILFTLTVIQWTVRPWSIPPPITERNLETVVSDLTIIRELIPTYPMPTITPETLRVVVVLYFPYLILTYLVRLRVLVGIIGTLILSWRAPWSCIIRRSLWRSAWIRWSVYRAWSVLAGVPLPPMMLSLQPEATASQPGHDLRFLFTVFENQRWWMGLDWTAALLPAERPPWSSRTQEPVSPPSAFTLPEPTTVFLKDAMGQRVRRTATWRWEEGEWKVLVKEDGRATRVEKPLPTANPESVPGSKMAGKMREPPNAEASMSAKAEEEEVSMNESADVGDEELVTDDEGWVYCDNKWEAPSGSNRINKYTRYRRWSRVAIVSEVVERVEPGEVGIQSPISGNTVLDEIEGSNPTPDVTVDTNLSSPEEAETEVDEVGGAGKKRATLRQRMHHSLRKGSLASGTAS